MSEKVERVKNSEGNGRSCFKSDTLKFYLLRILSAAGDRSWTFAVELYLVVMCPASLQVTAFFGFASGLSATMFGAGIGRWIDKSKRLKAATIALLIQNGSVAICAAILILHFKLKEQMTEDLTGTTLEYIIVLLAIGFGVIAELASIATTLILEKDWIPVYCEDDTILLTKMNATMRSISLSSYILAPILVGQLFTFGSSLIAVIMIVSWNLASSFLEYKLVTVIYANIPQLAEKDWESENNSVSDLDISICTVSTIAESQQSKELTISYLKKREVDETHSKTICCLAKLSSKILNSLKESGKGWKDYFSHPVRNAGLALVLVHSTVLSFDNIMAGYAYSQGLSASIVGIMPAIGAAFGFLGSAIFPVLRRKCGKLIVGHIGFGAQSICLIFCVVSIWAPGSPLFYNSSEKTDFNESESAECFRNRNNTIHIDSTITELWSCNPSVLLLMTGIILSIFGLWIGDLSVVQIFQEEIEESRRGVVNGVQGALVESTGVIKSLAVIIFPNSTTFSYFIGVSWILTLSGWVLFMAFSYKHKSKLRRSVTQNSIISVVSIPNSSKSSNVSSVFSQIENAR